jgi:murein DD-endopeptidase MepM/ murein hydrolase activator NlpD
MRRVLAACVLALLALAAVVLVAARPEPAPQAATTPSSPPMATADPSDTSRVAPQGAYGRIALDDRIDRTRRLVSGLAIPIGGDALPTDPELLPNAPREFRAGWHEGIDFPAPPGTEVHAVAAGTIIRIDRDFVDWSREQRDAALYEAVQLGYTPSATLDLIRGRQVWIDHGGGVVSRYAHLSAVADLMVDAVVTRGQVVGLVGSSGYPEGGPHLHLEIRVGTSYLGDGLSGDALSAAVGAAFAAP